MERGQSDTYVRLTRALSGPQVSVTKTYRDQTKMNISTRSQWPSSAVEYRSLLYSTAEEGHCDLSEILIFVQFHLYMSQRCSSMGQTTFLSVLGKCRSVHLPFWFVSYLSRFSLLYYNIQYFNILIYILIHFIVILFVFLDKICRKVTHFLKLIVF